MMTNRNALLVLSLLGVDACTSTEQSPESSFAVDRDIESSAAGESSAGTRSAVPTASSAAGARSPGTNAGTSASSQTSTPTTRSSAAGQSAPAQAGSAAGQAGTPSAQSGAGASPSTVTAAGTGGAGGMAGTAAAPASVDVDMSHYQARGPYEVERLDNQGVGTLSGATEARYPESPRQDPSAFTVYVPKNVAEGERFPLVTWGNGTYVNPTYYDELITHLVSHGFVLVGANDAMVGNGQAMLKAVEWAVAQNADSSSRLHGLIDTEHVGATGQSQGGSGTCNAGIDPRIDAIAPLSGIPLDGGASFIMNQKAPVFFINSANEDASSSMVKDMYQSVSAPAVYGVTASGDHNSYGDIVDDPMAIVGGAADDGKESRAGITAWFEWHLKEKPALRALFIGPDCGFCSGSTWKKIESRGF